MGFDFEKAGIITVGGDSEYLIFDLISAKVAVGLNFAKDTSDIEQIAQVEVAKKLTQEEINNIYRQLITIISNNNGNNTLDFGSSTTEKDNTVITFIILSIKVLDIRPDSEV